MLRNIEVNRRDICPGDIPRTEVYKLDDEMTVPELLQRIVGFLPYPHSEWEIRGGEPVRTLGFITLNSQNTKPVLEIPDDVCCYLTQQTDDGDWMQCCIPTDQTLKDLNVTSVYCADIYRPVKNEQRDEPRHSKTLKGLLKRFFGK